MSFRDLRRAVEGEIFDYQVLMHYLREYKKPRDKVSSLMKEGAILRVKKGLYVFGPDYQRSLPSQSVLANLIYTPSYISMQYALSYYQLIPEAAYGVTSICLHRSKTFKTPMGYFVYEKRPLSIYPVGLVRVEVSQKESFLIASPEKALLDLVSTVTSIASLEEMSDYLYEDMRMEKSDLRNLDKHLLKNGLDVYKMRHLQFLVESVYAQ